MEGFLIFFKELNDTAESLLKLSVLLLQCFIVTFFVYGKLQRLLLGRWCGCGIWWMQHHFPYDAEILSPQVYLPSPSSTHRLRQRDLAHDLTHVRELFIKKWRDDCERLRTLGLFNNLSTKTPFIRTLDQANYRSSTIVGMPNSPGRSYGGGGVQNSLGWSYGGYGFEPHTSLDNKDKYRPQRQRWGNTF